MPLGNKSTHARSASETALVFSITISGNMKRVSQKIEMPFVLLRTPLTTDFLFTHTCCCTETKTLQLWPERRVERARRLLLRLFSIHWPSIGMTAPKWRVRLPPLRRETTICSWLWKPTRLPILDVLGEPVSSRDRLPIPPGVQARTNLP